MGHNDMRESEWDRKLKIHTQGRDASQEDAHHHPYEPTPYSVLERLAESGYISEEDSLIDYGCGKGRVGFFIQDQIGCRVTGVEYDEKIYTQAMENLEQYTKWKKIDFVCQSAETYELNGENSFFFFNPFSVEILQSVMGKILDSYYDDPRLMRLFFYYPDEEYVSYLLAGNVLELDFVDEIDCRDLFDRNDDREKILVFEIGAAY